ncbi:hypothetical protein BDP81DRAFT_436838 [Colletotrichum phormii]|uniref:Uncharacterized protein n=1 Tax=Colletotrichum phormii TaxID=359342 RepID=A0AAJ0EAV0_9PEZI|nr:uncharacterized protein BDP81DRAFT_436838 [Colletotrichum phormii]KAK1624961.1 hypothetical protein BDP81DRAFT_436838 [Colletotrichum phormii]
MPRIQWHFLQPYHPGKTGQSFLAPCLTVARSKYFLQCLIKRLRSAGHDARRNGITVSITSQCQSELRGSQSRCEIRSIPRIFFPRCALVHREEHCLASDLPLYAWVSHFRSSDEAPSAPAEHSLTDNPFLYLPMTQIGDGDGRSIYGRPDSVARCTDGRSQSCRDPAFEAVDQS